MKKLIFSAVFLLTSLGINAQIFDLEDLMDFVDYYYVDEIIEVLEKQGYSYLNTDYSNDDYNTIIYESEDASRNVRINEDLYGYDDDVYSLMYQTIKYEEYEDYLNDLVEMGYERLDDESDSGFMEYELYSYEYDQFYHVHVYKHYHSEMETWVYSIEMMLLYY